MSCKFPVLHPRLGDLRARRDLARRLKRTAVERRINLSLRQPVMRALPLR